MAFSKAYNVTKMTLILLIMFSAVATSMLSDANLNLGRRVLNVADKLVTTNQVVGSIPDQLPPGTIPKLPPATIPKLPPATIPKLPPGTIPPIPPLPPRRPRPHGRPISPGRPGGPGGPRGRSPGGL